MWIDLFDNEGITNYVLGNGYMLYVIKKCGWLYHYSEQGWDNWIIKFNIYSPDPQVKTLSTGALPFLHAGEKNNVNAPWGVINLYTFL